MLKRMNVRRSFGTVIVTSAMALPGCSDEGDGASASPSDAGPGDAADAAAQCSSAIGVDTVDGDGAPTFGGVARRLEVRPIDNTACLLPDQRLAAMNWFTYQDESVYTEYGGDVIQMIFERDGKVLVSGSLDEELEAPAGAPANGGSYVHPNLAIPWYKTASAFLDMITSPEYQAILPKQQMGARSEDYVFGFQRCFAGCSEQAPQTPPPYNGLLLVHHFAYTGSALESDVETLAASAAAPRVRYAGELLARLFVFVGEIELAAQNAPWGNVTMVYDVDSKAAAQSWLASSELADFRARTTEDVLVLMQSGL